MMESTAITRELGARLRECREQAGLKGYELANTLGWATSKVSRLEHGLRQGDAIDVAMYLGCCGVRQEVAKPLLDLAQEPDSGFWIRPHRKQLPDQLLTLVMNETVASTICNFEPLAVPGLLQTEAYATEIMRACINAEPDHVQPRVQARLARQAMMSRPQAPESTFLINESVLRYPFGGPKVMGEQLLHLVLASSRGQIRVRVLPMSIGAHAGVGGPFVLMHYHDRRPVVWLESEAVSTLVEDSEVVDTYRAIRSELYRVALDEEESRSLLTDLASKYDIEERDRVGGLDGLA